MIRQGRSTLIDMAAAVPRRQRPWHLRRAGVAIVVLVVAVLAWMTATEALAQDGPGWLLYLLHDVIWVPFWSWIWVRAGFWSLMWLAPVAVIGGAALLEYLGLAQPLRYLQTAVLRLVLHSGVGGVLLGFQQILGWGRNHEGLLVAILRADLLRAKTAAKAVAERESRGQPNPISLGRAASQLCYLRAQDEATQIHVAEALALIAIIAPPDTTAHWRALVRRIWSHPETGRIEALTLITPQGIETLLTEMRQGVVAPATLALATLGVARADSMERQDLVQAWFTHWARLRHQTTPRRVDLTEAETLIDFEFWAARAETGLAKRAYAADRSGWLAGMLPGVDMHRPMGERAAAGLSASRTGGDL